MQRTSVLLLPLALGYLLMCFIPQRAGAQTPWPPLCIHPGEWVQGTQHTAVTQPIVAPCSPSSVSFWNTSEAEFVSSTQVHLAPGFHAGPFSGDGQFHAFIDEGLGAPADLVLIAPDPATHVVDHLVHVEKWEKLEVGLRLPQEYQDAIDRFFGHYYSLGDTIATPDSVDAAHDLNPYADDSLQLVMTLTSPSSGQKMKWGFYMTEAQWSGTDSTAQVIVDTNHIHSPYRVRFRFAPDQEGLWSFSLKLVAPHTTTLANAGFPRSSTAVMVSCAIHPWPAGTAPCM